MSRLLARIMLTMLLLPLAGVVYLLAVVMMVEWFSSYREEELAFTVAHLVTAVFVSVYWILLWRKSIRWTAYRKLMTALIAIPALLVGVSAGTLVESTISDGFGIFVGGTLTILLWLTLTIFTWRESAGERTARICSAITDAIICPACGYNMTGLREAICPECGARFTINELMASQPVREQNELGATESHETN